MKRNALGVALVATMASVFGLNAADATAIDASGTWNEFRVPTPGGIATGCTQQTCLFDIHEDFTFAPSAPWSFSGPAVFAVTDFGHFGDVSLSSVFRVFDNSILIGSTSAPVSGRSNCVARGLFDDPECNLLEGLYSHETFMLGAGQHNITISSNNAAPGFFKALAIQVPEPGTLALFGFGLAFLAVGTRTVRKQV